MKFRGVVFHLYHGKQDRSTLQSNDDLYRQSIREHRTRCEKGLNLYLGERDDAYELSHAEDRYPEAAPTASPAATPRTAAQENRAE